MKTTSMRSATVVLPLLFFSIASGQTQRYGDLLAYVDSLAHNMPSGTSQNDYQIPAAQYVTPWMTLTTNFFNRNDSLAAAQATSLSYRYVTFIDTSSGSWPSMQEFRILEKLPNSSNHWGTYILAANPARPQLILQAPHPLNDSKTGQQSVYVFRAIGARAFFLSGTHRCNSALFSACDGTTATCGVNEPYRESDPAHSVSQPFYYATVSAETLFQPHVVQLHGFAKGTDDPDLIMSNSTSLSPPIDLLAQIRDALLAVDNTLTFKIAHLDVSWTRLTGTSNVEGRKINGSSNPCSDASPANVGRFFHIEQSLAKLRSDATGWQKMASALSTVFPATNAAPDEPPTPDGFRLHHNYPNPFNPSTILTFTLPAESNVTIDIVDLSGKIVETLVAETRQAGDHSVTWNADAAGGVYFARLRAVSGTNTRPVQLVRKLVLMK